MGGLRVAPHRSVPPAPSGGQPWWKGESFWAGRGSASTVSLPARRGSRVAGTARMGWRFPLPSAIRRRERLSSVVRGRAAPGAAPAARLVSWPSCFQRGSSAQGIRAESLLRSTSGRSTSSADDALGQQPQARLRGAAARALLRAALPCQASGLDRAHPLGPGHPSLSAHPPRITPCHLAAGPDSRALRDLPRRASPAIAVVLADLGALTSQPEPLRRSGWFEAGAAALDAASPKSVAQRAAVC